MKYAGLRKAAQTGDIIFHAGNSLGAKFLRVFTASQYSHVGLLLWDEGEENLFVAEMKLDTGYTLSPASTRLAEMAANGVVRFGKMPNEGDRETVRHAMTKYRDGSADRKKDPAYSLSAAIVVWLAQWAVPLIPEKYTWIYSIAESYAKRALVCSTYVQEMWTAARINFTKLADPEDLARKVETLTKVDF